MPVPASTPSHLKRRLCRQTEENLNVEENLSLFMETGFDFLGAGIMVRYLGLTAFFEAFGLNCLAE